ncbi:MULTISPECIES: hypothetical protein [unclassified Arthrobacter]|uniref:hypothetical protein n=1 Tax=unclassified Arthrobacter TaxID=235627 RepID=UPI000B85919D|nr:MULTISPECIES: hypothetical protein [unclassified Arthrobacter]
MKNPLFPGDATRPQAEPLQCPGCRSSDQLDLEAIESIDPHPGDLLVSVSYTCRGCGASSTRTVAFQDVAAALNRKGSGSGLLQFGGQYFHCGEPMQYAQSSARSVYAPMSTEEVDDGLLDVYLKTRVIQCRCGFRMELPA